MTTPGGHQDADIGSLEIFGIPFSTFTRSITMGLEELGLGSKYIQHHTPPHSEEVKKRNPFGLLPVLVHRPNTIYTDKDDVVVLFESGAIRRYLDDLVAPKVQRSSKLKSPLTPVLHSDDPTSAVLRAKVDQWISLAATVIYPAVEFGVAKRRTAMEGNKADEATIQVALEDGVEQVYQKLDIIEKMMTTSNQYLCGEHISWADLFLYPPLADLVAIKEVSH